MIRANRAIESTKLIQMDGSPSRLIQATSFPLMPTKARFT